MDDTCNSMSTEFEDCDQCGFPAIKEISPYTKEYVKRCPTCGAIKYDTLSDKSVTKGYGSLSINGVVKTIFDAPITFTQELEVLKSIESEPTAVFLKWSDEEQALIAVKGELPKTFEQIYQEQFEECQQEKEYYDSISNRESILADNEAPFDTCIRPTGRIM